MFLFQLFKLHTFVNYTIVQIIINLRILMRSKKYFYIISIQFYGFYYVLAYANASRFRSLFSIICDKYHISRKENACEINCIPFVRFLSTVWNDRYICSNGLRFGKISVKNIYIHIYSPMKLFTDAIKYVTSFVLSWQKFFFALQSITQRLRIIQVTSLKQGEGKESRYHSRPVYLTNQGENCEIYAPRGTGRKGGKKERKIRQPFSRDTQIKIEYFYPEL